MFLEDMSKAILITEKAVVRDESVTRIVVAAEICLRPGCHHDIVAELSSRSLLDPTGEGGGATLVKFAFRTMVLSLTLSGRVPLPLGAPSTYLSM